MAYTEFMDILMYPAYKEAGITPRFDFEDDIKWFVELTNRAADIGDTKLSDYVGELDKESTMYEVWDYCFETIENFLK